LVTAVLAVIAGITLFIYIPDRSAHRSPDRSAHRSDPTCETIRELIKYTRGQTKDLNDRFKHPSSNPPPSTDDLQGWANGMRQYAEQLTKVDPQKEIYPGILTYNSQEIVYLFQYAESATFSGENPPPLWMKRYNDVAAELELEIHVLESDCPGEPTGTTTAPTPAPVPAAPITGNADITDKLLKPSELASIVGDADMLKRQKSTELDMQTEGVDPPDCAARVRVGNTFPYYGSGLRAIAGDLNIGARGQRVSQLITVWQDREQPEKAVSQSAYEWEHYCRQPFTMTSGNGNAQTHWVPEVHSVRRDPPTSPTWIITWDLREGDSREGLPRQICFHVMASRANVLVEDIACGDANTDDRATEIANQATEIANRMLNNFPR
jgi:PknH-like extracellular domain